LVYGDTYLTDRPHQTFDRHHRAGMWQWPEYNYDQLRRQCGVGPHPMWRRAVHDTVGYFDESYVALGDQDFWIRLGAQHRLLHIPVVTGLYWRSPEGLSNRVEIAEPEERRLRSTYLPSAETAHPGAEEKSDRKYDCSVIIPVWNRCELTRDCLTALAKTTEGLSWELIVVDNHSTDGTQEFLASLGGDVHIIRNPENFGFAKACNQGAQAARGRYLVFLNNDTIPQAGWLEALVREVEQGPDIAVVGSKLLYGNGTIQHAGVALSRADGIPYHVYLRFPGDSPAVNRRRECQCVTAACMLVRRASFEEVGGFDEGFRNGFEDVDLCLKIREKGYRVVYQPRSVLYHLESQTAGRKLHDGDNLKRLKERWRDHWWLADEDLHYHTDGYKLVGSEANSEHGTEVRMIEDIKDRAAWAHVAAAQAAAQKKDWNGVKRELSLVQDWPNDPHVLCWAAMVCDKLGEPALRHTFLTRYLELNDSPTVRRSLVRSLLTHKSLAAAEQQLNTLLAGAPDDAEGLLLRGLLCMQREQYREAETAFATAMQHGADRKKCVMGMGMASLGRAYAQGAWERFLEVLADNPDDADAIHWLLRAGTAQNRWDALSRHLRAYVLRNPRDLATRFALAGVLLRADQIEAARREHDILRAAAPTYDGLAVLEEAIIRQEAVLAMAGSSVVNGDARFDH
jgi:GT2 family glycosyltransferase